MLRRRTARSTMILATVLLATGCADHVPGTAMPAPSVAPATTPAAAREFEWLKQVLPNGAELSRAVGYAVDLEGSTPSIGDASDLRNTKPVVSKVSEADCLGVVSALEESSYSAAPVRAVTYATEPEATYGAVLLSSPDAAARVFTSMSEQWQRCGGRTVVDASGNHLLKDRIEEVTATDDVLSAKVLLTSDSPTGTPVQIVRALGVSEDCIVEAELFVAGDPATTTTLTTEGAVELVGSMMANVRTATR